MCNLDQIAWTFSLIIEFSELPTFGSRREKDLAEVPQSYCAFRDEHDWGGMMMTSQVVKLQVTASIPINCDFWEDGEDWKGLCNSPSANVVGSSFEDAKKNMASELQGNIESILSGQTERIAPRAA